MGSEMITGEMFRDYKQERAAKRADNRVKGAQRLKEAGIEFVSLSGDSHLRIGSVDYWPGTGLWKDLNTRRNGRGVRNLLNYLKGKS